MDLLHCFQLESGGKGEASGLVIGDIITCVNDVDLAGMRRTQAVELIRKSGNRLILSVERYDIAYCIHLKLN